MTAIRIPVNMREGLVIELASKTRSPDDQGQKTFAFIALPPIITALYGKNSMARARQAQTKDSGKIRKAPRGAEGEQGLCGTLNASS